MKQYSSITKALLVLAVFVVAMAANSRSAFASEEGRRNTAALLTGATIFQALKGHTPEAVAFGAASLLAWDRANDRDRDRDRHHYRYFRYRDRDDRYGYWDRDRWGGYDGYIYGRRDRDRDDRWDRNRDRDRHDRDNRWGRDRDDRNWSGHDRDRDRDRDGDRDRDRNWR